MADFFQWVSVREAPGVAFSFGAPPAIAPFLGDLWAGRRLTDPPPAFHVDLAPPFTGRLTDDFPALDHHCLLLSRPLVELLRKEGVDSFETHPCLVRAGPLREQQGDYSLMVLRDVVYCLDWEKSELDLDVENPRNIDLIRKLAVDEGRLAGCQLFRLGEKRQVVLVHAALVEAIQQAGLTGVRFSPVDGSVPLPSPVDQVGGEWPQEVLDYVRQQKP